MIHRYLLLVFSCYSLRVVGRIKAKQRQRKNKRDFHRSFSLFCPIASEQKAAVEGSWLVSRRGSSWLIFHLLASHPGTAALVGCCGGDRVRGSCKLLLKISPIPSPPSSSGMNRLRVWVWVWVCVNLCDDVTSLAGHVMLRGMLCE